MKKNEIKVGKVYAAKVTGKVVPVRIERTNPKGGWDAINMQTKRPVRIKSAQRLRSQVELPATSGDVGARGKKSAQATTDATATPGRDTGQRGAARGKGGTVPADRPMSLLDAAAAVLSDATEPLNVRQIMDQITQRGLWSSPKGRTPSATLAAAILRECKAKGDAARFEKAARGKYRLRISG